MAAQLFTPSALPVDTNGGDGMMTAVAALKWTATQPVRLSDEAIRIIIQSLSCPTMHLSSDVARKMLPERLIAAAN